MTANGGLWKSDGTDAGTVMVKASRVFGARLLDLAAVNGAVEFYAFDGTSEGLFRSDGTAAGTIELATNISNYDAARRDEEPRRRL